jgi:5-methylthioadenosine/S-adenosylhomocysteine deaminase
VSLYFAPPTSYAIGDSMLSRLRSVADELDARIAMPVHETALEVRDGMSQHGARPLHRLAKLGLLRPGFSAVHMNHLDENDLALAQDTGISVIACPSSNLRLGSGICPTAELLQRNVIVALGSDFAMSAGTFDVLGEARLAALLSAAPAPGRVSDSDDDARPSLSAAEALTMATLGGALALGLGATCGSIEPGKAADLVCIDLESLACESAASTAASLVDTILFGTTRGHVSDVWTGGRAAVSEGQLLALDEQELAQIARDWADRIQSGAAE